MLTPRENWLEECLAALGRTRVAVFGDFCLDAYWLIDRDTGELSIETGLPVHRVRQQRYGLGGAGNVVANLADLGVARVRAVGLIGDDLFGRQMRELLRQRNVDADGLLDGQADWQTLVYAKPCLGDEELNRVDFGAFNALAPATLDALAEQLDRAAADSDIVILNQQVPGGVSTDVMIERINDIIARRSGCRFIVDSRHRAEQYRGAMLKLNAHEAARLLGAPRPLEERISSEDADDLAARLFARTGQPVFVTRGPNGIVVADPAGLRDVPGIQVLGRIDPVGAGDAVLAALAAVLGSGGDHLAAARLANLAAWITIHKLQTTGTASPAELRAVGPMPDYVYLPELADDPRRARFVPGGEVEIIRDLSAPCRIRHAIFDHDGTLSTLRQGWEQIMEPMMVRAVLGPRYDAADETLYHKVVDQVRRFIDRTTGIQTLSQMEGLIELVRQFGCVPAGDILDIHGYKAVYNDALLAMVRQRTAKLQRGELAPDDFQIKGARQMLERLRTRGVRLYLASGTDTADVVAEAEALGYAHLFEGRIFGAVGDVKVEAKRVVLEEIFGRHNLQGPELATFGDGPVEMRETRNRGGVAVGVASDEVRRFGLNPAKRARLIRAGADVLVPDFSQLETLLALLDLPDTKGPAQ
jgi:rfaE bifunctional protein kinase chain/domain